MSVDDRAEILVCDTSLVANLAPRAAEPTRYSHWQAEIVDRLDAGIPAISVITLAEVRFGYIKAKWSDARRAREDARISAFLPIPLDMDTVDEWARLKALSVKNGWNTGDNDLWIAATASARAFPLITCDHDQAGIIDPSGKLEVLLLPALLPR